MGISFHRSPTEEPARGLFYQGLWMRRVSLSTVTPLGNLGRGSAYRELWELAEGGHWVWRIYLYGKSVRGTWRGAPLLGGLKVMKESYGGGHLSSWGSAGQPGVRLSMGDFGRWSNGALEVQRLIPYGSYVKGTWREGSLAGDPERYVKKAMEKGISSHRGAVGEPVRGFIYRGL